MGMVDSINGSMAEGIPVFAIGVRRRITRRNPLASTFW
jgi:hypothetical protein